MRTVLRASLRTHTRRYVAALLAVMVAVGFVVATNAVGSAARNGLSAGVERAFRGADVVVGEDYGLEQQQATRAVRAAERHGDVADVVGSSWAPVRHDGVTLPSSTTLGTVSLDDALRRQTIVAGRAPRSADEALVDERTAKADDLAVGDRVTLGADGGSATVRVVGVAEATSYLAADLYVPWATLARLPDALPDAVVVHARGDVGTTLATLAEATPDVPVRTTAAYVDARVVALNQGVDAVGVLLLLFATVAGFVAVLVVANTFTILFAQRTRDLALLRCVGATRRQVLRSVRAESVVVALVASVAGVLAGAAVGHGIVAGVRAVRGTATLGAVSLSPVWVAGALLGGLVVTVAAAWLPTRRVVRVSPLAALRPQDTDVRSRAGLARVGLGVGAVAAGSASLALAVRDTSFPASLVGGVVSFSGVLLLGPVLVPALLRLAGRVLGGTGVATRLAAANAVRNPRRSAATTASLLVGVTLATAVLTGMASARGALDQEMVVQYPVDVALDGSGPLTAATSERVAAVDGVRSVAAVDGVRADLPGAGEVSVVVPDVRARDLARDPVTVSPPRLTVYLSTDVASRMTDGVPERVELRRDGRSVEVRAEVVGSDWGSAVVAGPGVLDALGGRPEPLAVWAQADDGVDTARLSGDLGAVARDLDLGVTSTLDERGYVQQQLDVLTWSVLGLLAISVGIALVGIANTVGLSVLERGREHALLRALGLTRRELRRMLAAEGLLLALVASLVGTAVGVVFGWVGTAAVVAAAVQDVTFVTPWPELAAVVGLASVAGLLACVVPARRAARVAPAAGLVLD
jgi:putative ABC transport system permease protein